MGKVTQARSTNRCFYAAIIVSEFYPPILLKLCDSNLSIACDFQMICFKRKMTSRLAVNNVVEYFQPFMTNVK